MGESIMKEPTATEAAELLAEIKQAFAEMDRLREQMRRDQAEIERSSARTAATLDSLETMLKAM